MKPNEKILCVLKSIKDQIELTPKSKLEDKTEEQTMATMFVTSEAYRKLGIRIMTGDFLTHCDLNFFELENILEKLKEMRFLKNFTHINEVNDNYFRILPSKKFNDLYKELQNKTGQIKTREKTKNQENRNSVRELSDLHPKIYAKCHGLYKKGVYAEAVEKSFKVVRDRLRELTNYETGSDAFGKTKLHIKGAAAAHVDQDFNEGVKFLTMAVDRFRNEKSHTSDGRIDDPIRAYEYLRLSSLAMRLLDNAEILP